MGATNADTVSSPEEDIILQLKNITKEFPPIKALDNVSFTLRRGEIHGLVGENGAGKSTLLKILSGVHLSYEGEILLENKRVKFKSPVDAQNKGICMEYQEKTAFPNLSVAENIFAGHWLEHKNNKGIMVPWKRIHQEAGKIISDLKFDIDTRAKMSDITPEKQQIVQIAHAMAIKGKILILDEPTASISFNEVDNLFTTLNMLRQQGYSIIYVSHHLKEVFRIADRVTILKDGESVGTYNTADLDEVKMTKLMVGRDVEKSERMGIHLPDEAAFEVRGLTTKDQLIADVSLRLRKGEILGIAGLLGSGKELLYRVICGMKDIEKGAFYLAGKPYRPRTPKYAIKNGITALPAERSIEGLVLGQKISFNLTLSSMNKFTRYSFMSKKKEYKLAARAAEDVSLKYTHLTDPANSLSGGNQQRLMIGRALSTDAKVIIFNEPTQGVDVGAKQGIHKLIQKFTNEEGGSVILVSSELPELLSNCDRILVMSGGRINAEFSAAEATEELLLKHMIG